MGIELTREGSVGVATLDWPERRNALAPPQARELAAAITELGEQGDVSVVVITGNGGFCAGGDLRALIELAAQGPSAVKDVIYSAYHSVINAIVDLPKPVLAAVDGPAIGIGMDLALACDWRAIGPRGWFRHGWAELGVIPGTGGELLLRRLAPSLVWSLLGSGERITPERAETLGLAVSAEAGGLVAAKDRAAAISGLPKATLEGYVALHREELRAGLGRHLERCAEIQADLVATPEFRERAEALLAPAHP
jgi:enoyl-CoA hydratase/carnithine racemase